MSAEPTPVSHDAIAALREVRDRASELAEMWPWSLAAIVEEVARRHGVDIALDSEDER
jgi:hypothetical protein